MPKIRNSTEKDVPFIISSWLKSYYAFLKERPPKGIYFEEHHKIIERLLSKSQVLVCADDQDEEQILGWACFSKDILHYVFVKEIFQNFGVCRSLVEQAIKPEVVYISHYTNYCKTIKKYKKLIFNPYLQNK